jgi:hypothetical protein
MESRILAASSIFATAAPARFTVLAEVKASLPHGEFIPWVEGNMPVKRKQCSKYMRLAKERPQLLESNGYPGTHLDINNEIRLLTVDEDVEGEVREAAEKEALTVIFSVQTNTLRLLDENHNSQNTIWPCCFDAGFKPSICQ